VAEGALTWVGGEEEKAGGQEVVEALGLKQTGCMTATPT